MKVKTVIIPRRNKKDLDELPKYVKEGMNFVLADTMDEVLENAIGVMKAKKKETSRSAVAVSSGSAAGRKSRSVKAVTGPASRGNSAGSVRAPKGGHATPAGRRAKASKTTKRKV
jgi:hypothetical protein